MWCGAVQCYLHTRECGHRTPYQHLKELSHPLNLGPMLNIWLLTIPNKPMWQSVRRTVSTPRVMTSSWYHIFLAKYGLASGTPVHIPLSRHSRDARPVRSWTSHDNASSEVHLPSRALFTQRTSTLSSLFLVCIL